MDEAEKLQKAKAAIKAALADEDSPYHDTVTFFMEFYRDDVDPDIAAELFPGTDPAKLSFVEMVDFLRLDRFGGMVDYKMDQQVFIMDLSFNPEITDELMVIYFDLNQEIFCIIPMKADERELPMEKATAVNTCLGVLKGRDCIYWIR